MGLKKWHGTAGMVINDTKMGWNCDNNRQKHKYNGKMQTVTWLSPQFAKRQVLKFRLGTYITPLRGPRYPPFEQLGPILLPLPPTKLQKRLLVHHVKTRTANAHPPVLFKTPPNHTLLGGTCPFRPKEGSVPTPLPRWGLIIARGLCVSGHVVRASFFSDLSSRIRHRNALTEKAWEDAKSQTQTRQSSPVKNLQWNQQTKKPVRLQT